MVKRVDKIDLSKITTYQAGAVQASMHRLLQKYTDQLLEPFGLSKMQWMIVGHVLDAGKGGARISDLAAALGTTLPYITTNVQLLESKGFLDRRGNGDDSRSTFIFINPRQIKKCHKIEQIVREGLRKLIYAEVDPAEFYVYMKVMYKLNEVGKQGTRKPVKKV